MEAPSLFALFGCHGSQSVHPFCCPSENATFWTVINHATCTVTGNMVVQWRSEVCTDFYLNWGALEFISAGCQNCINSENSPNTYFFWDFGIRHFRLLKNSGFKQPFLDWALLLQVVSWEHAYRAA